MRTILTRLLRSGEERDISWSELFFDVVFVVVFARSGDELRDQLSLSSFEPRLCAPTQRPRKLVTTIGHADARGAD